MAEHSKEFPDSFFRVTVKGLCVRDGKVLMQKESPSMKGRWEIPGGGLDFGEDVKEGLKREVQEEAGLKITKISDKPVYVLTHKHEKKRKLEWYYSLILIYRIEVEDLNFTQSEECEAMDFFSKEGLGDLELSGQANELKEVFNPGDFPDEWEGKR